MRFDEGQFTVRAFQGHLIKEKDQKDTEEIARRILDVVDVDVLSVQEVEHVEILKEFNREFLGSLYTYIVLVEVNDQRLIDVGILSKLPIGKIVSHQTAVHPEDPDTRVFGRDLIQVEILDKNREKLFTLYNTHLKSHYVPFGQDPVQGAVKANNRCRRQTEMVSTIISKEERKGSRFVLTGDMNDPPDSTYLSTLLQIDDQPLLNALENPTEPRPPKPETPGQGSGPANSAWTHRYNPLGPELPQYEL